jgi:hypothetical protein
MNIITLYGDINPGSMASACVPKVLYGFLTTVALLMGIITLLMHHKRTSPSNGILSIVNYFHKTVSMTSERLNGAMTMVISAILVISTVLLITGNHIIIDLLLKLAGDVESNPGPRGTVNVMYANVNSL